MGLLEAHYAGRRGLLKYIQESWRTVLGIYAPLTQIDWSRVERYVFVCKGNICRSPYAEMRARGLGLSSSSYGLHADGDHPAYPSAQRVAWLRGIDLTVHRSRALASAELNSGDLVIVFEPEQIEPARQYLARFEGVQLTLLGLWSRPRRTYVADPYGRSDAYFQTCFGCIDSAVHSLIEKRTPRPRT